MKKPKKILMRLLSSYMVIILLLVFINFLVNNKTADYISEKILSVRDALFTQQKMTIDEGVKECFRIVSSLSEANEVISYADRKTTDGTTVLLASSIQNTLQDVLYTNESISDIYIYFKKTGDCLTTVTVTDLNGVFSRYHSENDTFDMYENFMKQTHTNEIGYLNPENLNTSLMYSHTIKASGEEIATVVILLNKNFLHKLKNTENETIMIVDNSGICFTSGEKFPLSYNDFHEKEGRIEREFEGERYSVAYKRSSVARLFYLSVFNLSDFWEDFNRYRTLFLVCLLLFLVVGGILSFYFVRKNYTPIKKILNILPKTLHSNTEKTDELMLIENALQNSLHNVEIMQGVIQKQKKQQINSLLLRILRGKTQYSAYEQKILGENGISFLGDGFIVALFYIEDYRALFCDLNEKSCDEEETVRFAIKNIMEELFGEKLHTIMLDVEDLTVAAILNHSYNNADKDVGFIRKKAGEGLSLIRKKLKIRCFGAISTPVQGTNMLPKAFSEAENVYEYRNTMEIDAEVLCYSEIDGADSIYNYSYEEENRLKNLIGTGSSEEAIFALHALFRENTEHKKISNEVLQCLKFSVLNAILQQVEQDEEFIKRLNPVQRLSDISKKSDIMLILESILREVCMYIKNKKEAETQAQLGRKIKDYILQNYMSTSLNVNEIGNVFNMTPYYISKKFRDETGESLLECINAVRIEKAKILLKEGDKTIEQIANEVGYTNSVTFNRLFRKAEGISPGEYRKKGK